MVNNKNEKHKFDNDDTKPRSVDDKIKTFF